MNRKINYDCQAILFRAISREDYEKLQGKKKSSVVKRQNPEEYYTVMLKQRIYHVTPKVKDDFRVKKRQ